MPGITRKLAGVVKIYEDPLVYVHDSPGVMVPFLGHGELGAERGLKFALTGGLLAFYEPLELTFSRNQGESIRI